MTWVDVLTILALTVWAAAVIWDLRRMNRSVREMRKCSLEVREAMRRINRIITDMERRQ